MKTRIFSERERLSIVAMVIVLLAAGCSAQEAGRSKNVLTNRDVVTLANAGFDEEFIVEMITTSRTVFDTTADGMADLAKHGIKEDIIRAMRSARPSSPPSVPEEAFPPEVSGRTQPIRIFIEPGPNSSFLSQQTAEIVKTFVKNCPKLVVTSRREAAAYTVALERASGKLFRAGTTRMVIFDRAGDMVYGASERAPAKALRGFCKMAPNLAVTNAGARQPDGRLFPR